MLILRVSQDNLVRWDAMRNGATEEYINDAVVSYTLRDSANTAVSGATSVAMGYVPGSDGRYEATLDKSVALVANRRYYLELTATRGLLDGFRRVPCLTAYQQE